MTSRVQGSFEVKLRPQPPTGEADDPGIGRMAIEKQFRGGLEANSRGEMLAVRTATEGSAGYVAMERVIGTLEGRSGSFALQHFGLMTRGAPELTVVVVPDSGTGELLGLAGKMSINSAEAGHVYEFAYTLPDPS